MSTKTNHRRNHLRTAKMLAKAGILPVVQPVEKMPEVRR